MVIAVGSLFRAPAAPGESPDSAAQLARQAAQYNAEVPKTIFELQPFRATEVADARDGPSGASLVNLNPHINIWFVLTLDRGGRPEAYHLENPRPDRTHVHLDPAGGGLRISEAGRDVTCALWSDGRTGRGASDPLAAAMRSGLAYAPLCEGRLLLRNKVRGAQTTIEQASDILRDYVPGGEAIIGFVKGSFYQDKFRDTGTVGAGQATATSETSPDWPLPAAMAATAGRPDVPKYLGIAADRPVAAMGPGRWYPARGLPGVFVSYMEPGDVAPEILKSYRDRVNALDDVESDALVYLVAFDLAQFDLGFALGTDHPRIGWSPRPIQAVRDDTLPGPDGVGSLAPLVPTGMVSPALAGRTVATFAGGFRRQHGAFRYGPFAERNHGSHYGFIEQGAILSKLQPGLATLFALDDGTVEMKSWTSQDDALLPRIRQARQNGVPIIEAGGAGGGIPVPGALVARWGPGNWSGTAEEKLRSVRAGACLQETPLKRFLLYAYFSDATPSAMARAFQAYGCRYAMLLDMNALEHTYLAVYPHDSDRRVIEHLVEGMALVDKKAGGNRVLARFLEVPDDRDFFYLTRRESAQTAGGRP
ncbi:MAG TPA: hypothetical protein VMH36_04120 [Alphaproteobacteria bacterium]|nr:hypothetical protein [Alphaproteobacteria bacterium]